MEAGPVLSALAGGALIGSAAAVLLLLDGRIAGISGILGGTLASGDRSWRLAFLAGLVAAPALYVALAGASAVRIDASPALLVCGGLLVGFGTRLGSGCTSGHGVCGMARLSPRSLAATGLFMAATVATVFVIRHVLGRHIVG